MIMVISKLISGVILLKNIKKQYSKKKKIEFVPYDYHGNIKKNLKPQESHIIVYKNYRKRSKSI